MSHQVRPTHQNLTVERSRSCCQQFKIMTPFATAACHVSGHLGILTDNVEVFMRIFVCFEWHRAPLGHHQSVMLSLVRIISFCAFRFTIGVKYRINIDFKLRFSNAFYRRIRLSSKCFCRDVTIKTVLPELFKSF